MSDRLHSRWRIFSPGRVNLLGEHVDYNDGQVLPAAIDRYVKIHAEPLSTSNIKLEALDLNSRCEFSLEHLEEKKDKAGNPLPDWALYPAGVAYILQNYGVEIKGLSASITSNVPIGAGLSSSAAVEVGFAVLWQAAADWEMDRMTLARLCQQAENEYVGVKCGLMDQFACANGVKDHAVMLDTRSLEMRAVPLPAKTAIVISDTGVRRKLTSSGYNERRVDCETAVSLLKTLYPSIRALRDLSPSELEAGKTLLPQRVYMRARHVVTECLRVQQALRMLEEQDAAGFGRLMVETHRSLREDYEVSCPELDVMVESALALPGCLGVRLTGAGFGGCTVNLVREENVEDFIPRLVEEYGHKTGLQAKVYLCHASQGAWVED